MKIWLVLALSFGVISSAVADINDGLIAYYPFNGTANDESSNNTGVVYGATLTKDRFGTANRAYRFNNAHDKIEVQHSSVLNFGSTEFSIAVWVNTSQTGIWKRIITKRSNTNLGNWYSLAIFDGKARFETYAAGDLDSITKVNDGRWHLIVITRNLTNDTLSMYIDGSVENTMSDEGRNLDSGNAPLEIGVWAQESHDTGTFNGTIDDVRIYNRVLSSSDVNKLYMEVAPGPRGLLLDIDGDGKIAPLSDGLLLLRYQFGFLSDALINNAIDTKSCTRCSATEIEKYIQNLSKALN